jgi:hypothetical protein
MVFAQKIGTLKPFYFTATPDTEDTQQALNIGVPNSHATVARAKEIKRFPPTVCCCFSAL